MSRLPFDPAKMQGPATPAPQPAPAPAGVSPPLTVSQLCARVKGALDAGFPASVRVAGEVSGFSDRTHWYFALKDAEGLINCVMFASASRRAGFTPATGTQVVATGRVDFYAPAGKVTLLVEKLEPVGAGAREVAFRALVDEARALGWLDPSRKRALPIMPRRVGIVTSATGAALQDVLVTMRRRCAGVEVLVLDIRVQGERAAPEAARAIDYLGREAVRLGLDALLVTRGGGSPDDLWAFNERVVADAIVKCPIPVVAAIGHETDTTLAELVADERAATPTQAAMRLTPDAGALGREVRAISSRLTLLAGRVLSNERTRVRHAAQSLGTGARAGLLRRAARLDDLGARLARRSPAATQARALARVDAALRALGGAAREALARANCERTLGLLEDAIDRRLERAADTLDRTSRHLEGVGPLRVLERGYSVTMTGDGRVVRAPSDVQMGAPLLTRVAQGVVRSVVLDASAPPPMAPAPAAPRRSRRGRKASPTDGPGLFESAPLSDPAP
ncbi:MAG: exodeoxyribonuclease VII large subunit [Planctomycetota bacterium]|nr:exodeoxyribonuclease VII large subunit [Planctomycetota bacterium]